MDQDKIWESFGRNGQKQSPRCLAVNTVLAGKYLVGPVLGEGGFGITYMGYDLNMKTRIAIKEYFPVELVSRDTTRLTEGGGSDRVISLSGEKSKTYQQGLKKYVDEARNVSQFSGTPGVVSVKDFFYENDTAYIVMEYIEGVSLKGYLKQKGGKLSEEEALAILRPVLEALEKVHEAGIVHRDISPDNIMLTLAGEDGASGTAPVSGQAKAAPSATAPGSSAAIYGNIVAVRLIDFGAARMTAKNDQKSLTIILKHGYAPEEQYRSHGEQGPWTDVYALCAVLYRMLTGTVPEPAMDRLFSDGLKRPEELGAAVSPAVSEAIMRGLAVKKENRIQTMRELSDALYAGKKLKKTGQEKQRRIFTITALAAACILGIGIAGAGILFLAGGPKAPDAAKQTAGQTELAGQGGAVGQDGYAGQSGAEGEDGGAGQKEAADSPEAGEASGEGAEVSLTLTENTHELGEQIVWPKAETMIAGGRQHLIFLQDDGTVLAAGSNSSGQCDVQDWKNVAAVYASGYISAGLCTDGTVLLAGRDTLEQAVSSWQGVTMLAIGGSHILGLTQDGRVISAGTNTDGCCETGGWEDIQSVWAVDNISYGVTSEGNVLVAGGPSVIADEEWKTVEERIASWTDIRQVVGYMDSVYGLMENGTVRCEGYVSEDKKKSVEAWENIQYLRAEQGFVAGLKTDGTLVVQHARFNDQRAEVEDWGGMAAISSTGYNLVGLCRDGSILITEPSRWGNSRQEELLCMTDAVQAVWLEDGLIVLRANGTIYSMGFGKFSGSQYSDLEERNNITQIASNYSFAVGLRTDGTVICPVGRNSVMVPDEWVEEMGVQEADDMADKRKEETPDLISGWKNVQDISLGGDHAAALFPDGSAAAAGFPEDQGLVDYHTCLTTNGSCEVDGWTDLKQILALNGETIGLKEDGTLVTTGEAPEEWADYTDIESIWGYENGTAAAAIRSDGTVVYLHKGDDAYGQNNVNGWTDMVQLSVGRRHTVGLRADGTVAAVGDNFAGQCEVEDWSGIVSVAAGDSGTIGITDQGRVLLAGTLPNDFYIAEDWPAVTVPDGR